jgi:hypothetical protein
MGMAFKYFLEPQNFGNSLSDFQCEKMEFDGSFFIQNVQ